VVSNLLEKTDIIVSRSHRDPVSRIIVPFRPDLTFLVQIFFESSLLTLVMLCTTEFTLCRDLYQALFSALWAFTLGSKIRQFVSLPLTALE
jgi:hypothetical protein